MATGFKGSKAKATGSQDNGLGQFLKAIGQGQTATPSKPYQAPVQPAKGNPVTPYTTPSYQRQGQIPIPAQSSPVPPAPTPNVSALQQALVQGGFMAKFQADAKGNAKPSVDGNFGPITNTAYQAYQKALSDPSSPDHANATSVSAYLARNHGVPNMSSASVSTPGNVAPKPGVNQGPETYSPQPHTPEPNNAFLPWLSKQTGLAQDQIAQGLSKITGVDPNIINHIISTVGPAVPGVGAIYNEAKNGPQVAGLVNQIAQYSHYPATQLAANIEDYLDKHASIGGVNPLDITPLGLPTRLEGMANNPTQLNQMVPGANLGNVAKGAVNTGADLGEYFSPLGIAKVGLDLGNQGLQAGMDQGGLGQGVAKGVGNFLESGNFLEGGLTPTERIERLMNTAALGAGGLHSYKEAMQPVDFGSDTANATTTTTSPIDNAGSTSPVSDGSQGASGANNNAAGTTSGQPNGELGDSAGDTQSAQPTPPATDTSVPVSSADVSPASQTVQDQSPVQQPTPFTPSAEYQAPQDLAAQITDITATHPELAQYLVNPQQLYEEAQSSQNDSGQGQGPGQTYEDQGRLGQGQENGQGEGLLNGKEGIQIQSPYQQAGIQGDISQGGRGNRLQPGSQEIRQSGNGEEGSSGTSQEGQVAPVIAYHGTATPFDTFDDGQRGSITGAQSANGAHWLTDNPRVARAYATYAAEDGPINSLMRENDRLEAIAQKSGKPEDWDKVYDTTRRMGDLDTLPARNERRQMSSVKRAELSGDYLHVDAEGKTPQELSQDENIDSWLNSKLKEAKAQGKDGVVFHNLDDAVGLYDAPATHYAVFDARNIKVLPDGEAVVTTKPQESPVQQTKATPEVSAGDTSTPEPNVSRETPTQEPVPVGNTLNVIDQARAAHELEPVQRGNTGVTAAGTQAQGKADYEAPGGREKAEQLVQDILSKKRDASGVTTDEQGLLTAHKAQLVEEAGRKPSRALNEATTALGKARSHAGAALGLKIGDSANLANPAEAVAEFAKNKASGAPTPAETADMVNVAKRLKEKDDLIARQSQQILDMLKDKQETKTARGPATPRTGKVPTDAAGLREHFAQRRASGSLENSNVGGSKRTGAVSTGGGARFTQEEIGAVWKYTKENYIDSGQYKYSDVVSKVANDLGLSSDEVNRSFAGAKGPIKQATNDLLKAQYQRRLIEQEARIKIASADTPAAAKFLINAINFPRNMEVLGHANAMVTHAGNMIFSPAHFDILAKDFIHQYKMMGSPAIHEATMRYIENHPRFQEWRQAGLAIDTMRPEDYGAYNKALGWVGQPGSRAMDILKMTRLELAEREWQRMPAELREDPQSMKLMADWANHATGKGTPIPILSKLQFGPALESARWARSIGDPLKTIQTTASDPVGVAKALFDPSKAGTPENYMAQFRVKQSAAKLGVMMTALAMNQFLLKVFGSKQNINITRPQDPDWLAFKANGQTFDPTGGTHAPIHFLAQMAQFAGPKSNWPGYAKRDDAATNMGKEVMSYNRGKLAPGPGILYDLLSHGDFTGRPLPHQLGGDIAASTQSGKQQAAKPQYTLGEYALAHAPIPGAEFSKLMYEGMRAGGASQWQAKDIPKALVGLAGSSVGVRVGNEPKGNPGAN